jgi:5-methylcytosine-specific restriction endonuclease McrA
MLFDKAQRKLWRYGLPRCEHRSSRFVLVTTAGGARGVREQCADCGYLDSTPHKLAEHPEASPADTAASDQWQSVRVIAGRAAQVEAQKRHAMRQAAKPAEDADWWAAYDDFLHGDLWQQTRMAVLRRDAGRCTAALPGCTREAQQVHHDGPAAYMYHRRLGSTPAFLLHSVCVSCHAKITEADRAERGAR